MDSQTNQGARPNAGIESRGMTTFDKVEPRSGLVPGGALNGKLQIQLAAGNSHQLQQAEATSLHRGACLVNSAEHSGARFNAHSISK